MFKAGEIINVLGFGRCTIVEDDGVLVVVRTSSGEVYTVAIGECRRG
jgi:hypothetical protein